MRQNLIVVLLSVIATLLLVLVLQQRSAPVYAQQGGGASATVGTIGVATGSLQGSQAAGFWIFLPDSKRLAVYDWGSKRLRLRAVRNVEFDLQMNDFNIKGQSAPSVNDIRKALRKRK